MHGGQVDRLRGAPPSGAGIIIQRGSYCVSVIGLPAED